LKSDIDYTYFVVSYWHVTPVPHDPCIGL